MNEMKLASWRFSSSLLPGEAGEVSMSSVDLASHPDLVGHLADWEPFSHQLLSVGGGDMLLTVMLRRRVEAPDTPAGT